MISQRVLSLIAGLAFAAAACADYPEKPVKIVVGFTPGGGPDIIARHLAQELGAMWKQQVIVENRPGAGGSLGAAFVAKAPADGYTLLSVSSAHAAAPAIYAKLPYDASKDFAPVAFVVTAPNILVVTPALAATSTKELIALAKAKPGQLNYGSGGAGQTPHLAAELFKSMAEIDMRHIPYKGGAPATADLLAGRISVMFGGMVLTLPHVRSGKLRALATTGARRAHGAARCGTSAPPPVPSLLPRA